MEFTNDISMQLNLTCYADCPVKEASNLQIFFFILGIFGLILNAMVIHTFWISPAPPTKWGLTNLSIGTAFALSFSFFKLLKGLGYISLDFPISCRNWGFFERMSLAFLPPTMLVLFYESTQHTRVYQEPELSMKASSIIFVMALVISIPGYFTYKVTLGSGEYENVTACWKIFFADWRVEDGNFFLGIDWRQIHIFYEAVFTVGISMPPCFLMVLFLHDMRFKIAALYLFKPVPSRRKKHVSRIRWAFAYVIFYHLCYLLPSCIHLCLTILSYYDELGRWDGNWRGDPETIGNSNLGNDCSFVMTFLLVVLHPIFLVKLGFVELTESARSFRDWLHGGRRVVDVEMEDYSFRSRRGQNAYHLLSFVTSSQSGSTSVEYLV